MTFLICLSKTLDVVEDMEAETVSPEFVDFHESQEPSEPVETPGVTFTHITTTDHAGYYFNTKLQDVTGKHGLTVFATCMARDVGPGGGMGDTYILPIF